MQQGHLSNASILEGQYSPLNNTRKVTQIRVRNINNENDRIKVDIEVHLFSSALTFLLVKGIVKICCILHF